MMLFTNLDKLKYFDKMITFRDLNNTVGIVIKRQYVLIFS